MALPLLYKRQQTLAGEIATNLMRREPMAIQAGQRSGKSLILGEAMKMLPKGITLYYCNRSDSAALNDLPQVNMRDAATVQTRGYQRMVVSRLLEDGLIDSNTYFILDDAFWSVGVERLFTDLAKVSGRVVAMGSASEPRWASDRDVRKYATWDLNDELPREHQLFLDAYELDPYAAERDYGYGAMHGPRLTAHQRLVDLKKA